MYRLFMTWANMVEPRGPSMSVRSSFCHLTSSVFRLSSWPVRSSFCHLTDSVFRCSVLISIPASQSQHRPRRPSSFGPIRPVVRQLVRLFLLSVSLCPSVRVCLVHPTDRPKWSATASPMWPSSRVFPSCVFSHIFFFFPSIRLCLSGPFW